MTLSQNDFKTGPKSADDLDADAYALEARAAELHARAARLRAAQAATVASADWIPIGKLPLAKKSARALARSGAFETRQIRGRTYANAASFNEYMNAKTPSIANDDDDVLRSELGIAPRRSA